MHLASTTEEYSRYNIQWNGTSIFSDLAEERGAVEVRSPDDLAGYTGACLLLIAPDTDFDDAAAGAYRSFLERGNTIVLADDFGTGNQILGALGSEIRILPGNLSSMDMEYSDPHTVIAYRTANATLVDGVETLMLNRPAALEGGEILVQTSILSWIDADGNRHIDAAETLGKYGVVARESVGAGEIYVISDPSLFINTMVGLDSVRDNHRLIGNILEGGRPLLLDAVASQTRADDGIAGILHTVKSTTLIKTTLICTVLLLGAYAFRRKIF
ncbi:DUF4350 domain-containing protein [Methanoculleus frigidifontis]|uniref:DUF4350 domain-containing protein n=1 Tax=Methanoculleus frigidifontis TaxID=2584085 RepID=UPI00265AB807|nr:DUF4350 domain-containing protein [Methanoculleus sp. FWC-SCC1]